METLEQKKKQLSDEHFKIVKFLRDNELKNEILSDNLNTHLNEKEKVDVINLLKIIYKSFGLSQKSISEKKDMHSYHRFVSRTTGDLNRVLQSFCHNKTLHAIQLYFATYHSEKIKNIGCHLVCTTPKEVKVFKKYKNGSTKETTKVCSHEITPLEEALNFDSDLEQFRSELKQDAIDNLRDKLHGEKIEDYRPLELEIGTFDEKKNTAEKSFIDHNRDWKPFHRDMLLDLQGRYILTSDTGRGKTTFLRRLQLDIIKKDNGLIPIYLHVSEISDFNLGKKKFESFLRNLSDLFKDYVKDAKSFLLKNKDKIVFLIDGLDQIPGVGSAYINAADEILKTISNRLVLTSRPFAITQLEQNRDLAFLRLKPFSPDLIEEYYGDHYDIAIDLCHRCREMLSIPMLAYMVRLLIIEGQAGGVDNRTQLYERFIDYLFDPQEYKHENLNISESKLLEIRRSYEKLSYDAINNEPPDLQQIPFDLAHYSASVEVDILLKLGLSQLYEIRRKEREKILYFSHQSFQEYLAAVHISEHEDLIAKVLNEKWNPKWKEVLRFLVGLNQVKGNEIIDRILNENDFFFRPKLLLAAKLVPETKVPLATQNIIYDRLLKVPKFPGFFPDLANALYQSNYTRFYSMIRSLIDHGEIDQAVDFLSHLHAMSYDNATEDRIIHKLQYYSYENIIHIVKNIDIQKLNRNNQKKIIFSLINCIKLGDNTTSFSAAKILNDTQIDESILHRLLPCLEHENPNVVIKIINLLGKTEFQHDELTLHLLRKLKDTNPNIVFETMVTCRKLKLFDLDISEMISSKIYDDHLSYAVIPYVLYQVYHKHGIEQVTAKILELSKLNIYHISHIILTYLKANGLEWLISHDIRCALLQEPHTAKKIDNNTPPIKLDHVTMDKKMESTIQPTFVSDQQIVKDKIFEKLERQLRFDAPDIVIETLGEIVCLETCGNTETARIALLMLNENPEIATEALYTILDLDLFNSIQPRILCEAIDTPDYKLAEELLFAIGRYKYYDKNIIEKIFSKFMDISAILYKPFGYNKSELSFYTDTNFACYHYGYSLFKSLYSNNCIFLNEIRCLLQHNQND
ncbi:putative NTPase (NACHT family) [Limihaloglobus sulfuriphilus]|uniref:Putative NTPase (NACHT family) n=1 Tax=Limihaloglobus sulfuriphilus TaxID=1851148 RepID=A0A1Q2MFH9_9BACT|nr:NACHT domain-containing protein [Limihaloglobus sulfuriphilus]AQQ71404.1 putative NTPase (NACHT family) [Limihaloglobus sulfuriphilus]